MDKIILSRDGEGIGHANIPQTIVRHSPTGMEWGYAGSGPADLALNILLLVTDEDTANSLYQQYKFDVVSRIPRDGGEIAVEDVRRWVASHRRDLE